MNVPSREAQARLVGGTSELFVPASQNLMRMHALDGYQPRRAGSISPLPLEERFPSIFIKYAMRNAFDFALASVCVILDRDGDSPGAARCAIVLGAVAATPYRARDPERVVVGNVLTDEVIHEAARAAVRGAEPLALNEYQVALVQKMVTEALQELRP